MATLVAQVLRQTVTTHATVVGAKALAAADLPIESVSYLTEIKMAGVPDMTTVTSLFLAHHLKVLA